MMACFRLSCLHFPPNSNMCSFVECLPSMAGRVVIGTDMIVSLLESLIS